MITRVHTTALIFVPLASVAVSLWLAGEPLSSTWLTSFGAAEGATLAAFTVFNRWLWKWRWLQGWFVKCPILEGQWRFTIDSSWFDPATESKSTKIAADVTIKQTYTKLHMQLKTPESSGDLISSKIIQKDNGTYQITGIFRNEPRIFLQDKSRIHLGALVLDVVGEPSEPKSLEGQYWTNRSTKGEINGSKVTSPE